MDGTRCDLYWDGRQRWRAECAGRSRDYVHPHPWHGADAEFYRMQDAASNMRNQLMIDVWSKLP